MNKTFITILTALMLVFSSALVLADPSVSVSWTTGAANLYQEQSRTLVANVTNNGNVTVDVNIFMNLSSLGLASFNQSVGPLDVNASTTVSIPINTSDDTNVGPYILTLSLNAVDPSNSSANYSTTSPQTFSVLYPFCEDITSMGDSPISLHDIKNRKNIDGKDFNPLDEFELKVKVRNSDDDDNQYARVEMVIVQGSDEVDDTLVEAKAKISDSDYYTFTLKGLVPADIEEGKAYLYVRAYNDDDENNCEQDVMEMNIEKRSKELAPLELEYPKEVSCGDTVTFSGKIANIGNSDEDKVLMTLSALSQTFEEEYNDFDSGDISSLFNFDFKVPINMTEGSNKFVLRIDYDYDEDDENFDDADSFNYPFTVKNCKIDKASFTTETSTALTNTESEVRFLISNPTSYAQTFTVLATADWATISSVTPQTVKVEAGKQQYVSIKLTPNKDVESGIHTIAAKISYGSTTESLSLPVSIQSASTSLGLFGKIGDQFKNNTMWAVTDVVLVVAILVLLFLIFAGKRK